MKTLVLAIVVSLCLLALAPSPPPASAQVLAMACPNYVAFSITAAVQLVAFDVSQTKRIAVCSFVVVAGAAEIFSLVEGIGTACGTETVAVIGSATAASGLSLAANGVLSLIASAPFVQTRYDNYNLCVAKNGSNRIAGAVSYVIR